MLKTIVLPVGIALLGLLVVYCAAMQVPFFMNHRKAVALRGIIGDTLARVFYIAIGLAITAFGALLLVVGVPD